MRFIDYLKDYFLLLFVTIIELILVVFLLVFLEAHVTLIVFIPFIMVVSKLFIILHDYFKKVKFYNSLESIMKNVDNKFLVTEIVDRPNFLEGNILYDALYFENKNYIEVSNKDKRKIEDFKEYIELWCHEIKTPIATSKLVITNNKNEVTTSILEEVEKMEDYVNQMLYYARSENVEKDYIISKIVLNKVVNEVIKKNKKSLINKKIKIICDKEEVIVESDFKWLEFIIDQVISNSIKYSKEEDSKIEIRYKKNKNNVILTITDNGIGISSSEVSKVFDKGFTGSNGRKKYNSTGMGLYLCKKLCDKLGHNISISSSYNVKTTVTIIFPSSSLTLQ